MIRLSLPLTTAKMANITNSHLFITALTFRAGLVLCWVNSWWRWDLSSTWNPLTIMRPWQLWHFDDANIHIPEHKGEEMKEVLAPLSVPSPPPPQPTSYHRPFLLLLHKHTNPKPTKKANTCWVNMVAVADKCKNKWLQRRYTNQSHNWAVH